MASRTNGDVRNVGFILIQPLVLNIFIVFVVLLYQTRIRLDAQM
jgi:hypothetical protein